MTLSLKVLLPLISDTKGKKNLHQIQWSAKIRKQTSGRDSFRVPDTLHTGLNCKNSTQMHKPIKIKEVTVGCRVQN